MLKKDFNLYHTTHIQLGDELERMHPKLYSSVARQVSSRGSGGDLQSAENTSFLLSTIARDLFRTDITWGKVVALFAITGGLALDCVRQGHAEFVPKLIESMADVIEDELVVWISENGGWVNHNWNACFLCLSDDDNSSISHLRSA